MPASWILASSRRAAALLAPLLLLLALHFEPTHAFLLPSPSTGASRIAQQPSGTRLWGEPPKRLTITEQLKLSPNRWKRNGQPLEPGVGGIWPGRPDAKTYKVRKSCCVACDSHVGLAVHGQACFVALGPGACLTLTVASRSRVCMHAYVPVTR